MEIKIRQIEMEQLLAYRKEEEVWGYCSRCKNHGINYSCPAFDFDVEQYLDGWKYASVIVTKTEVGEEDLSQTFDIIKRWMGDRLIEVEAEFTGSLSMPPGCCNRCNVCLKDKGLPCIHPDQLRYSLEALGFKVSDIFKEIMEDELVWDRKSKPAVLRSCSVLLSKKPLDPIQVKIAIGEGDADF